MRTRDAGNDADGKSGAKKRKEERSVYRKRYYSIHDGDVPRIATTDFASDNNANGKRERRGKRKGENWQKLVPKI